MGHKQISYPQEFLLTSYREGAKLDGIKIYDREILFLQDHSAYLGFKSIPVKCFRQLYDGIIFVLYKRLQRHTNTCIASYSQSHLSACSAVETVTAKAVGKAFSHILVPVSFYYLQKS